MTAKEYLSQLRWMDLRIESKTRELEDLRARLGGCSARQMDGMPHAFGSSSDPIGDAIAKIVDLESCVNKTIDEYIDRRAEVTRRIDEMDDPVQAAVLRYRYILRMNWEEIADTMGYTMRQCFRIHGHALLEFTLNNKDVIQCHKDV